MLFPKAVLMLVATVALPVAFGAMELTEYAKEPKDDKDGKKGKKGKGKGKGSAPEAHYIGLWGDLPYLGQTVDVFDPEDIYGPIYQELSDGMNDAMLDFSIHSGDIKGGGASCGELSYSRFEQIMNSFNHPALVVLGDNDWTDCHRLSNGNYDPLERLEYLRGRLYTKDGRSLLGTGTLKYHLVDKDYPEIGVFTHKGVTHVLAHVVGSNDGLYDGIARSCDQYLDIIDPGCAGSTIEQMERLEVNIKAMKEGFMMAEKSGSAGVMVSIQANIFRGPQECRGNLVDGQCPAGTAIEVRTGFIDFWTKLVELTNAFGKPVVLFHGDSHYFQVFPNPGGVAPMLTAVQNPGSGDIGWILANVDPMSSDVFTFTHIDNTPSGRKLKLKTHEWDEYPEGAEEA